MIYLYIILLIATLYILAKYIIQKVFQISYALTRRRHGSIILVSLFFLIGTAVHELSHLITALVLNVKAGNLSVFPEVLPDGGVRAGKISVAKTDPIRQTIIGIAPLISGLCIIYAIGTVFLSTLAEFFSKPYLSQSVDIPMTISGTILLFMTTNTMFSSKKDLESLIISVPILGIILIFLLSIGIEPNISKGITDNINFLAKNLFLYLIISVGINTSILCILILTEKLTRRLY